LATQTLFIAVPMEILAYFEISKLTTLCDLWFALGTNVNSVLYDLNRAVVALIHK
jgi:hypothetical protein